MAQNIFQMKKEEVSQFYDQFSERQIKIGVNERLIFLFKQLKKLGLTKKSKILELGCGVGAFTYLLSKKVEKGYIEAVDLSEKSIENAQKNIQKNNVQLFVGDVVHYRPQESDFDFITLLDVIEHIPIEEHFNLFKNISTYISEKSLLLINIPNPEYIKYLHQHQPESLQVIDQPIELPTLAENLDKNDLEIIFFQKYGIWEQEDYHLFLVRKKLEFKLRHLADERTLTQKITKKLRQKLDFIKFS